jgi:hypothetical protein
MSEAARRLFEEAMSLSAEERSLLAKQLLQSVVVANDELDADELSALDEALEESERQFAAGQGREFFTALAELRARS